MNHIFGFGSLVNDTSHPYDVKGMAVARHHRREWVSRPELDYAFLSMAPCRGVDVFGVILGVPPEHQPDLDAREAGYTACSITDRVKTRDIKPRPSVIQAYRADFPPATHDDDSPILRSYLDCVFQGYLTHFGSGSLRAFVETTKGWQRGIRDDRAAPLYPRSVKLTPQESDIINDILAAMVP